MNVNWGKCSDDGHWCSFENVKLDSDSFKEKKGVYIIQSGEIVVRLGSGIIKDRLAAHREDSEVNNYQEMKVTWAKVNENQMQGVEKYLADTLNPVVGERFPDRTPIEVNLPWD